MARPARGTLWRRLGEPTEQVGSVNDPRTREEFGLRYNEKWLYRDPDGDGCDRVVLWHRYDLRGVVKVKPDGSAVSEPIPEA